MPKRQQKAKKKPQEMKTVELEIDSVAFGGKGVGRKDGKVFFVRHCVTGDVVEASIEKSKKKFAEGYATKILKPSLRRGSAKCPYFGACGGCDWQDIDYSLQKQWKLEFVKSGFKRVGKLENVPEIRLLESPELYNYRSRVLFRCHIVDGKLKVGFFKRATRELVEIKKCEISDSRINQFLEFLNQQNWSDAKDQRFRLEIQVIGDHALGKFKDSIENSLILTVFLQREKNKISRTLLPSCVQALRFYLVH